MKWPLVLRATLEYQTKRADAMAARIIEFQDELRALRARCERAEDTAAHARADSIHSRELVADWLAQKQFGSMIFNAPPLPSEAPHAEQLDAYNQRMGRGRARDVVKDATAKYYAAYAERLNAPPE